MGAPASFGAVTVLGGGMARDCYLAVKSGKLGNAQALTVCDLALEQERLTKKNRAATLVNRGILHMRDGRNGRALADFEASLKLLPDLLEAKVNQGAALYGLDRLDEAMAALNEGIHVSDIDALSTAYYNRALVYLRKGDVQASYDDFKMALQVNPQMTPAAKQLERFQVISSADS
jgi:tetratricopeptide (TPR) repeat protein